MRHRAFPLACLVLTTLPATLPATAATCGRAAAQRLGRWFATTPVFPAHPPGRQALRGPVSAVRAAAVDPADPRVLFVTNGVHLLRSNDGGCSWRSVYALSPAPATSAAPDGDLGTIRSVDVVRVGARPRVLLAVQAFGDLPAGGRTVVVRSDDGYGGWTAGETASFPGVYGKRGEWAPQVHSVGGVAYAAVPSPAGGVAYWRSVDGGRTWSVRSAPADLRAPARMTGFAVNPWNPDELWEWGGRHSAADDPLTGLRYSTDGAATWTSVDPWAAYDPRPSFFAADVAWPRRGGPARVILLGGLVEATTSTTVPAIGWSGDGGRTFAATTPPRRFDTLDASITHLPNGDAIVVAENRVTFRVVHRGRPPVTADWRELPKPPEGASRAEVGHDAARAGTTVPTLVLFPNSLSVQLLTVKK